MKVKNTHLRTPQKLFLLLIASSFVVSACDVVDGLPEIFPANEAVLEEEENDQTGVVETPAPTLVPTQVPIDLDVVKVWVEPQFDFENESPQAQIFKTHVDEYINQNPGIKIQFRLKEPEGANSILNSLAITAEAAPDALPTIVLLSRHDLEKAAMLGLIRPIEFYASAFENNDWYPFAQKIGLYKNEVYGLPMTADVMVLAASNLNAPGEYTPLTPAPREFGSIGFPAGNSETLVPYLWYQSADANLRDQNDEPILEQEKLLELFSVINENRRVGNFSSSFMQYASSAEANEAFSSGELASLINWSSALMPIPDETSLTFIPALSDAPYTYANGWIWCLVQKDTSDIERNIDFMQHLISQEFLSQWTPESDFLPVRQSSIPGMRYDQAFLDDLLMSANVLPSESTLEASKEIMLEEVNAILSGETSPEASAENILTQFEEGQTSD